MASSLFIAFSLLLTCKVRHKYKKKQKNTFKKLSIAIKCVNSINKNMMQRPQTLKERMLGLGYSQNALARHIALDKSMLSLMVNGKRKFRFEHKERIAQVLLCSTSDIIWPDK
jgi:DNA-binding Xre family transcriptional regulator